MTYDFVDLRSGTIDGAVESDDSADPVSDPLIFVHLPKTAGTSIAAGISAAMARSRIQAAIGGPAAGGHSDVGPVSPTLRRMLVVESSDLDPAADFIHGHLPLSFAVEAFPAGRVMTILRDPRSRLLSHWLFARAHTESMLRGWGKLGELARLARQPLQAFLSVPRAACLTGNLTVRYLIWPDDRIPDTGFVRREDVADLNRLASDAMGKLSFVGLTEDPALRDRVSSWLQRPVAVPRLNESRPLPKSLRVDIRAEVASAAELLTLRTALDQQLWDQVVVDQLGEDPAALSARAFSATIDRYAASVIGSPTYFRAKQRFQRTRAASSR